LLLPARNSPNRPSAASNNREMAISVSAESIAMADGLGGFLGRYGRPLRLPSVTNG
jgi:hypothetical protein